MAYHFHENVSTKCFTPRQYQVEVVDHAREGNIIVCLGTGSAKTFIATKLIQELSRDVRRKWRRSRRGKRTLYLVNTAAAVACLSVYVRHLTDLTVAGLSDIESAKSWDSDAWEQQLRENMVLVMVPSVCVEAVTKGYLKFSQVNLVIVDECHLAIQVGDPLNLLMKEYGKTIGTRPRVLGLTPPMLDSGCDPRRLDWELSRLEDTMYCRAETASDIVSVLRHLARPKECILQYEKRIPGELDRQVQEEIEKALEFLDDHRYDPSEIYDEEFHEEIKAIPDPTVEPKDILKEFLQVLQSLGPWCADRAALVLLSHLEKLKVKTPYERHFLLLCMVSSVMVKIRAICERAFQPFGELECIYEFSSPKVFRLLEILKQFKPAKSNRACAKCQDCSKIVSCESSDKVSDCSNDLSDDVSSTGKCGKIEIVNKSDNENPVLVEGAQLESVRKAVEELVITNTPQQPVKNEDVEVKTTGTNVCSVCAKNLSSGKESEFTGRGRGRGRGRGGRFPRRGGSGGLESGNGGGGQGDPGGAPRREGRVPYDVDPDALCGIIFVHRQFTAKILYYLLNVVRKFDDDLSYLGVQFVVEKTANALTEPRDAESEHRKQEEVLKRFRMHECNLLVATSVLEEGIDTPRCNLVVRFEPPLSYRSYVQSKGRARAPISNLVMLIPEEKCAHFVRQLAEYMEIEQVLLKKCGNHEDLEEMEKDADLYSDVIVPYKTNCVGSSATLGNAISLVNHYCAKLPSDTFTRLTPIWWMNGSVTENGVTLYSCTLRLPINSPVKQRIVGPAVPNPVLARRLTALETVKVLHRCREIDDKLCPIGKESFRLANEEAMSGGGGPDWGPLPDEDKWMMDRDRDSDEARPGTTKRRQYYYKRVADDLTDCRPVATQDTQVSCLLYHIKMTLTCPLPEEQNTRGRRIYPPEESAQGFGILTLKRISKICPFPIFTRSGEVQVSLHLAHSEVQLTKEHIEKIVAFLNYTFTSVLRLQKYLMLFDPNAAENSYFIVPTRKSENIDGLEVDWEFLDRIYAKRDLNPEPISEEDRKSFQFDASKYQDAVVMPWYRNQDQPQYFYVAEICTQLSPSSSFPSSGEYTSFQEYYFKKYDIRIQNQEQPLLDVDHTSARLNFLTPRYVNRKGVALPTSSEETKRAKRENLEQKQILVPELCTVHPFPASLWRKAVCLPCILYRINALLLADQVRRQVAWDIGLGVGEVHEEFEWLPLNFGWSLADVLKTSKEKKMETEEAEKEEVQPTREEDATVECQKKETDNEEDEEEEDKKSWMEIGTWSNDLAANPAAMAILMDPDPNAKTVPALPSNVTLLGGEADIGSTGWGEVSKTKAWDSPPHLQPMKKSFDQARYGSPTSWNHQPSRDALNPEPFDMTDSDMSYSDDDYLSDEDADDPEGCADAPGIANLRIQFKSENVAEALDDEKSASETKLAILSMPEEKPWHWHHNRNTEDEKMSKTISERFEENIKRNKEELIGSGVVVGSKEPFAAARGNSNGKERIVPNGIVDADVDVAILPALQYINIDGTQRTQTWKAESSDSGLSSVSSDVSEDEEKTSEDNPQDEGCGTEFSFDQQPPLEGHPGPSPAVILQALTMSNANDGINLERLETIGDSFLKYAITTYLYCTYDRIHEGKLSHMRSKQVSNLNLYRLGRRKNLGESMIATKFEPHDNWLPPCYYVPRDLENALIEAGVPASHWNRADLPSLRELTREEISQKVYERRETLMLANINGDSDSDDDEVTLSAAMTQKRLEELQQDLQQYDLPSLGADADAIAKMPRFIPYNLITQHSIPDKSVADCVEALIGAYLIACGPRGALLFMAWLGIQVLPWKEMKLQTDKIDQRPVGSLLPVRQSDGSFKQVVMTSLDPPCSPLLRHLPHPEKELSRLLDGFETFERDIGYQFQDRSYLLQALTHASYSPNELTDCYQRLEFLGDAVLDYLITRHLYQDWRQHSPGALTDLRSALVNNTIFASLAVRFGFHKYFRHLSPGLSEVVDRFVHIQEANGHLISEEYYLTEEEECEEAEDVEVPKALGDVFESVAGAIFLDSGMSLDAVWKVYYRMMRNEIELFSTSVPKSPIRELLEMEPETAKFGKPEKLADGRRVRVTVEVFSKGTFKGIGRNYRIAKCTAAKCALKQLKKKGLIHKKN